MQSKATTNNQAEKLDIHMSSGDLMTVQLHCQDSLFTYKAKIRAPQVTVHVQHCMVQNIQQSNPQIGKIETGGQVPDPVVVHARKIHIHFHIILELLLI